MSEGTTETPPFTGWAIVELMGHRRLAGFVTEQTVAGAAFLRLDVPADAGDVTQFYAPSAVYCITPTTEEIARSVARSARPAPVNRWELPSPAAADDDDVVGSFGEELEDLEDYE